MSSPLWSERRPGPTARTSPCWGFSLAVSGMTRPLAVVSSDSPGLTTIRSSRGCRFIQRLRRAVSSLTLRVPTLAAWHSDPQGANPRFLPRPELGSRRSVDDGQTEVGLGAEVEPRGAVGPQTEPTGRGDHRRVVGAHRTARHIRLEAVVDTDREQPLAKQRVRGHTPAETEALRPHVVGRPAGLGD